LLLTKVLDVSREHLGALESRHSLIALHEAWNKPEKAKEWQSKLAQIVDFEE
jgi:hypothetical protein